MGPGEVGTGRAPGVSLVDLGCAVAGVGEGGAAVVAVAGGVTAAFAAEPDGAGGAVEVAGGVGDKLGGDKTG